MCPRFRNGLGLARCAASEPALFHVVSPLSFDQWMCRPPQGPLAGADPRFLPGAVAAPVTALPLETPFQACSRVARRQSVQSTSRTGSMADRANVVALPSSSAQTNHAPPCLSPCTAAIPDAPWCASRDTGIAASRWKRFHLRSRGLPCNRDSGAACWLAHRRCFVCPCMRRSARMR